MAQYFCTVPAANLAHVVKFFWAVENETNSQFVHHAVASGLPSLVFNYRGKQHEVRDNHGLRYPATHLQSQTQSFRSFSTTSAFGIFGVTFYPFVASMLFSASAAELTNQVYSLECLLGNDAREIEERIYGATSNADRVKIFSGYLENKIAKRVVDRNLGIQKAIRQIIDTDCMQPVAALAHDFNLSKRQFERKFKAHCGFSPKLMLRITRFRRAYTLCERDPQSFLDLALRCGYFDNAHLTRDFKTFSGLTPTEKADLHRKGLSVDLPFAS